MDLFNPYLEWIDKERESTLETLKTWSDIHSGSHHYSGLETMLQILKEAYLPLKGIQKEIDLPSRTRLKNDGTFIKEPLGRALSISLRPEAPIKILLTGHMDIAYPADLPLEKCIQTSRDILTGRGTADMKAGLLVMLLALKALEMSPFSQKIGWQMIINPDEEIGSPGSRDILREAAKHHHIGLIFEPALPDGSLVSARKGSANYTLFVQGKAAHAGREFQTGRNAITSAARFAIAAESLTDLKKGLTVNVGYLNGGGPLNIVPDRAMCGINIRAESLEDFKKIKEQINQIMNLENQREGITLILHQDAERPPKIFDEKTRSLFESLKTCSNALKMEINWKNSGGACDGNILSEAGLPTIDTLGAVGGNLHTSKEYVNVTSILMRAKLAARFMMQLSKG